MSDFVVEQLPRTAKSMPQFVVAPDLLSKPQMTDLGFDAIRYSDRAALIRELVRRGEEGWRPSLEDAASLTYRVFADRVGIMPHWSQSSSIDTSKLIKDKHKYYIDGFAVVARGTKLFGEIKDFDDLDGLYTVFHKLVLRRLREIKSRL